MMSLCDTHYFCAYPHRQHIKKTISLQKADRKSFIRITRYIKDKIMNAKGKILIIDDNEDVLFALNLLLDPYVEK